MSTPPSPPSLPYSPPTPPAQHYPPRRAPLAEQAAKYSFFSWVLALFIGCVSRGSESNPVLPSVTYTLFAINLFLIVSGLAAAIFALASIPRLGPKGILVRALIGLLLNGLILAVCLSVAIPIIHRNRTLANLAGHWRLTNPTTQLDLTFNPDHSFVLAAQPSPATNSASLTAPSYAAKGHWLLSSNLEVGIEFDDDHATPMSGKKIRAGTITSLSPTQLNLQTPAGAETYTKIP